MKEDVNLLRMPPRLVSAFMAGLRIASGLSGVLYIAEIGFDLTSTRERN